MNRLIKMQEEQYPLSSPSYDNAFFNHCLTTFYDHDSDEIIQAKCSTQEVLFYLQNTINLCDTPLGEIMKFVEANDTFKSVDIDLLKRKIIKQKNILKRNRAKGRSSAPIPKKNYKEVIIISEEGDDEFKKQRNRISAQLSRDKKKLRVKQLEEMNKKLQEECNIQKMQNERLRISLEAKAKKYKILQNSNSCDLFRNKVARMLIFLGIICLFGMIRDLFFGKETQTMPISTLNPLQPTSSPLKNELSYLDSSQQKRRMLELIETPLMELVQDTSLASKVREKVRQKFGDWRDYGAFVPQRLKQEIQKVKELALS